ncbi:MAG: DUF2095 family protein [Candidatus Bathyarchaeota archaeon]|jgi:hypothetical protein
MNKEKFRKLFPHLAEEMERGVSKIEIIAAENDPNGSSRSDRRWSGYEPGVVDFIRRCNTEEQAEEIIEYLEERREISANTASKLREQLRGNGLRSFGEQKGTGYYHRNLL